MAQPLHAEGQTVAPLPLLDTEAPSWSASPHSRISGLRDVRYPLRRPPTTGRAGRWAHAVQPVPPATYTGVYTIILGLKYNRV